MAENEKISLLVHEEQKDTIYSLYGYYGWDVNETSNNTLVNESSQTDGLDQENQINGLENDNSGEERFIIQQDQDSAECPFCFCKPCITDEKNRQMWWETESQPQHRRNHSLRKEKYKYFWTMMFHRDVWRDDIYQMRKQTALARDPKFKNYIWHKRDIMPDCVLKLVRRWHPNPDNLPYMGHLWE